MISNKEIRESLDLLNNFIETKEVEIIGVGLCYNCKIPVNIQPLFKYWQHYSGDCLYPVPSEKKEFNPYDYYHCREHKLYEGDQLELRLSLAKFVIEKLNEIKIEQDRIRNLP